MSSLASGHLAQAVFDLPESVLDAAVRAACPDPVEGYRVSTTPRSGTEGICGEYLRATFTVTTEGGATIDIPMFVRRQLHAAERKRQAHHYAYLSAKEVPLPRMYGSHVDDAGREVLLLELLEDPGGSDNALLAQEEYLVEFLELAAALAAVPLDVEYVGRLGYDVAGRDFVLNWADWLPWSVYILGRIESKVESGILGDGLRAYCHRHPQAIGCLKRTCLSLMGAVRTLPLGLVHGDFRPGNTGRSRDDARLVLYDLEDLYINARFFDVGQIIGGPKCPLPGKGSREDLAQVFLQAYAARTGRKVDLHVFMREARLTWAARKMNLWELLPPSAGGPPYDHRAFIADERERAESLLERFAQLFESLPMFEQSLPGAT
jgi:hypothetical protein